MSNSFKKLTSIQRENLEQRMLLLLFAGLDWCANTNKGSEYWFNPNNPYCSEAFGILQCLEVLGFGFFGADNDANPDNLKCWFRNLQEKVKEKGLEFGDSESYRLFKENI